MKDVKQLTVNFYTATDALRDNTHNTSRFDDTNPSDANASSAVEESSAVDERLLRKVWNWLVTHPDVTTKTKKIPIAEALGSLGHVKTTENVLANNHEIQTANESVQVPASSTSQRSHDEVTSDVEANHVILLASEDRMWRTLAGHGKDYTRIRDAEFTLLSLIGAAGPAGIPQPELTRLSGQDKRSLPHRTLSLIHI